LALSDFHQVGTLNNHLGGKRFSDDEVIETDELKWLRQQPKDFYAADFNSLVKRRDKSISVSGGYIEK
jgi:hypothetical protein